MHPYIGKLLKTNLLINLKMQVFRMVSCFTQPSYHNIRKILAPLYKNYNSQLARILFGDGGVMNFVITK